VPYTYRPAFGRVLAVAIGLLCAATLIGMIVSEGSSALWRYGPWLALIAGTCWALFWRPELIVDDGLITLVNPFRTVELPWPSIQRVDTKWALTLYTAYGTYAAWANPAPNRYQASRVTRNQVGELPESTYADGSIRPGDDPSTPSGHGALLIRRHWEELRDAGHLDDPKLERARPVVRWHLGTLAVGAVLLVAIVLGLLI